MDIFSFLITVAGVILATILLLLVCGSFYLAYIHNKYSHLPGPPRSSFFLGHLPEVKAYISQGKMIFDYYHDMYEQYGPIFVLFLAKTPYVLLGDPAHIKHVFIQLHNYVPKDERFFGSLGFIYGKRALGYGLVTNTNPSTWRRRRLIIGQAFHRQHLKELMSPFNTVTDKLLDRLASCATQHQQVAMYKELGDTTLDIIAQVAFSTDLRSIGEGGARFRKAQQLILQGVQDQLRSTVLNSFLHIYQSRLLQSKTQRDQIEALKLVRDFAEECVSKRLATIKNGEDAPNDILSYIVKCVEKDEDLTIEDLVDEFITMFFAGHETTASSLAFTLFEVISNPEIEQKIFDEVQEVIGDKERVDYNDLAQLKYVGRCIMEGLRKYMVAGGPVRLLKKDTEVGRFNVPSGCLVIANKYAMCHSASYWEDPMVFDPDRFASPESIPNFQYIYFPFSVGPRNCVGQTFAMIEEKVLLARLIQKFKFQLLPGQTSKMDHRLTIAPKDGVRCKVELR